MRLVSALRNAFAGKMLSAPAAFLSSCAGYLLNTVLV
jgi:hypothetical protein